MMSDKKDLSPNVKTVLHGEVLGPEDEGYEPKAKESRQSTKNTAYGSNNTAYGYGAGFSVNDAQNYYQNPYHARWAATHGDNQMSYLNRLRYWASMAEQQEGCKRQAGHYGCIQHRTSFGGLFPCKNCGMR
jgi:hypothetical protein